MPLTRVAFSTHFMTNTTLIRRQNALALFQAYAEKSMAQGLPPKGLEQAFAASLQISPSMWSQIKSSRPIGDKLARQIEQQHGKRKAWLDETQSNDALTTAEQSFLTQALQTWRAANSAGRKALRAQMKVAADEASSGRTTPPTAR
jgi:hypothetical protein